MQKHYLRKSNKPKPTFSLCKYCKAKIFWTVTEYGKNMPVDYDRQIEYLFDNIGKVYFEAKLMKPHWSTCPYSEKIKQIRRGETP